MLPSTPAANSNPARFQRLSQSSDAVLKAEQRETRVHVKNPANIAGFCTFSLG